MANVHQICHFCPPSLLTQLGLPDFPPLRQQEDSPILRNLAVFPLWCLYFPSCLVIPLRSASSFNAYLHVFRINKLDMLLNLSWPVWFPPAPRIPFGRCLSGGSLG